MECEKCSCVILNYNDADTTIDLVERIRGYDLLRHIIIVDNCSTDDSWEKLQPVCRFDKVILLSTAFNGGYGYGNQYGVSYAYDTLGVKFVLIINPDVSFTEECLAACLSEICREVDIAIVSPLQVDQQENVVKQYAWNLGSGLRHLLSCEFLLRHSIFPLPSADIDLGAKVVYVDCVPGSFLLVDAEKFLQSGGYHMDMFLYWEETMLAFRVMRMGWKTLLLPQQKYFHNHSVSIQKSIPQIVSQRRIQHHSLLICLREIWGYGKMKLFFARLFLNGCLMEEHILTKLKLLLSGRN